MANTIRPYTGDGTTVLYPVDFDLGYIRKDYIYVYLEGSDYNVQLDYTYINETQIQLTTPVSTGVVFNIRRVVPRNAIVNDYEDGAAMHEENLDDSFKQAIMALEEIQDGFTNPDGAFSVNSSIDLNELHRVINSADPIDGGDLVNLSFLRSYVIDEQGGLALVNRAEAAVVASEGAQVEVEALHDDFRDDYMGNGPTFPAPRKDGSLWYYDGADFTQGLYIHYPDHNDPFTGTWELVSGVGPQGATGAVGMQGAIGVTGEQGIEGPVGIQGQQGIQGAIGDTGPSGITGETGSQGPIGPQGVVGPSGDTGSQGPVGPDGPNGPQGVQGNLGPQGDQGDEGPQGPTGPTGPQGVQGVEGPIGPEGTKGNQGIQGQQGIQGNQGLTGDTGNDGQSFQIDATGTLAERTTYDNEVEDFKFYASDYSVTADETPNQDRVEGDGVTTEYVLSFVPDGPQSLSVSVAGVVQGVDMYTVDVTVAPNEEYTVTFITPPANNAQVVMREFSIATGYGAIFIKASAATGDWGSAIPFGRGPRGDQGPVGVQGATGVQGSEGDQGSIGIQGTQGAEGIVGPQGATGGVGPQGTIGATGSQGPEGVVGPQGAVGIQGSTGPEGPVGTQGATGIVGPQGYQGDVGPQGQQGSTGDRGPTGIQGSEGERGPLGTQGPQGVTGATGSQGAQGPVGAQGGRGDTGAKGPTGSVGGDGVQGDDGADGAQGPSGDQGIRGSRAYYTSNKTSWTVATAITAIGTPLVDDLSTQYFTHATEGFSETRSYSGGVVTDSNNWRVVTKVVDNVVSVLEGATGIVVKAEEVLGRKVLRATKTFTIGNNIGSHSLVWTNSEVAFVDTGYSVPTWGSGDQTFLADVRKNGSNAFDTAHPTDAKWAYDGVPMDMTNYSGGATVWVAVNLRTYAVETVGTQNLKVDLYEII